MRLKAQLVILVALALFGRAYAEDYDDEPMPDGYGGGGEDEDYGGGGDHGYGGGDEEESPPPAGGGVQKLESIEEFDSFLDDADASVVGAFTAEMMVDPTAKEPEGWDSEEDGEYAAPEIENPALSSFKTIADSVYGYRYAYTTATEVLEKMKSKAGGVYLYRSPRYISTEHGDRPRERFPSDKLSESAVSNWLASKAQPLVGEYTSSTKDRYKKPTLIIFMNLDLEGNSKSVKYVLKRARKAAVGLKGKLSIAVASISSMNYELSDFGLTVKSEKSDILMGIREGADYSAAKFTSPSSAFSADALSAFAKAYLSGELTPYERPADPDPPADSEGEGEGDDIEDDAAGEGEDKEEV